MIVPAVHDRACGHRGLLPAGRTFPARPAPLQFPAPVMAAGGADEAVGPAPGGEMPGTGGFIGKARLEGGAGHGAVIFPAPGHHGTLHEHPADAHQKLNISSNRAQRDTCLSMKVRSPMPCSCSCLSPTRSQRRRRELHDADSDMAQRLETAMAHTLRLGSLAELHG